MSNNTDMEIDLIGVRKALAELIAMFDEGVPEHEWDSIKARARGAKTTLDQIIASQHPDQPTDISVNAGEPIGGAAYGNAAGSNPASPAPNMGERIPGSGLTGRKADWVRENFDGPYEMFIDPDAIYDAMHGQESRTPVLPDQPVDSSGKWEDITIRVCKDEESKPGGGKWIEFMGIRYHAELPEREVVGWQPLETAPPGYTKDKGFEHVLFKGHSKAGSFAGNVYVSGWMDTNRKPIYEYSYKLIITGWKPLSVIDEQGRRG